MENFTVEVSPETFEWLGLTISQSQVTLFIVTLLLVAFGLVFRYYPVSYTHLTLPTT